MYDCIRVFICTFFLLPISYKNSYSRAGRPAPLDLRCTWWVFQALLLFLSGNFQQLPKRLPVSFESGPHDDTSGQSCYLSSTWRLTLYSCAEKNVIPTHHLSSREMETKIWTGPICVTLASSCHTLLSCIYNYRLRIWKVPYFLDSKMWFLSVSWRDEVMKWIKDFSKVHRIARSLLCTSSSCLPNKCDLSDFAFSAVANNSPDN